MPSIGSRTRRAASLAGAGLLLLSLTSALAGLDVIAMEDLKEKAVTYGKISQRFTTCKIDPPQSIRVSFLKYAKSQGASDQHLEILVEYFTEGQSMVRGLRSGFSEQECKEKVESPAVQELLVKIEEWSKLPGGLED